MARVRSVGWRSARFYGAPGAVALPAGGAAAPPARGQTGDPAATEAQTGVDEVSMFADWPWKGVQWSLSYVGFLLYVFVVTSYEVNLGTVAALTAIFGLFMGEKPRFTPVSLVFILFLGMMTLSYLGSEWRRYIYGDWENMIKVLLIFWVAQSLLVTRERVRFFVFFYLGVFGLWPVRGGLFNAFIYHSFTQGRVAWNQAFANPNDLGALLLFPLGLAASVLVVETKKQIRLAATTGVILIPLVVAFTQSRGAIIGVVAAGAYLFVRNKKARVGMLVGGSVLAVVLAIFAPNSLWDRLGSFNEAVTSGNLKAADDHGSADQRLAIWKVSAVVIGQHPLLGVGPGAYPFAHLLAARSPDEAATARGLRDTHSTYFNVMAEYGIPAFLVFMTAAGLVWAKSTRARKIMEPVIPRHAQQLYYAEAGLLAFAAAATFGSYANLAFTYVQLAIVYALAETGEQLALEHTSKRRTTVRAAAA